MGQNKLEQDIQAYFQNIQAIDNLYEEYARKNGLTYMSLYVLETIYEQEKCTQKLISEITLYPKQTVNMVIRSFLKRGWVLFEQDESDRRNKYVKLTDSGEIFAKKVVEPYWDAGCCAFGELKKSERLILLRTLKTFTDSFVDKVKNISNAPKERNRYVDNS